MVYSDFDKLEAFFIELRDTNFHPERMRSKLVINGQWTTINQGECFNLLRQRIPDLQGKDDKELVEYLKDPKKVKDRIIGKLIKSESDKLTKAVEEKPAPTEAVGGEAVPQNTATEQAGTTGQATGASSGSLPFGMPSGPAISPVIHPVPRVPPPAPPVGGREGGTGEGTAATRKINKQANLTSTKVKQPTNRFNFPAFRSKVGGGVVKFGSSAMGIANPFLGRMGNQVIGGLTRIANPLGGGGAGSRSIFGRFSRGGGVRFFGGAGRGVSSLGQTAKKSRALLALVALLGFMALVGGIAIITGTNPTGTTPPGGTAPAAGNDKDIASCTFYRGGDSTPGIRFNIPEWPTLITDVATKVGVPPSIVAGILRVECPGCFSTTDPSYIKNDFDDHNSFDDKTQLPVAFGVTQFTASTFAGLDVNTDIKPKFPEKTGLSLSWIRQKDFVDKYHGNILDGSGNPITQQRYTNPTDDFYKSKTDNLMRIYSVRDSIIATAVKAKKDAGVNPPYDQNTVNKIANSYYGGCEYIQNEQIHSYCDDLWNSYSQCQNASAPAPVSPGLAGISSAATQITSLLYQTNPASASPEDRLYHNKKDEPGVYYWCTYLIIDAYNAAGFSGLTRPDHGLVVNMRDFFKNNPKYQFLPPNTPVEQLRPGDTIIFEGDGQHASLIKSINLSPAGTGNGDIKTFEANNVVLEDIVPVQNHQAAAAQTTAGKMSITGFGQIKN